MCMCNTIVSCASTHNSYPVIYKDTIPLRQKFMPKPCLWSMQTYSYRHDKCLRANKYQKQIKVELRAL